MAPRSVLALGVRRRPAPRYQKESSEILKKKESRSAQRDRGAAPPRHVGGLSRHMVYRQRQATAITSYGLYGNGLYSYGLTKPADNGPTLRPKPLHHTWFACTHVCMYARTHMWQSCARGGIQPSPQGAVPF